MSVSFQRCATDALSEDGETAVAFPPSFTSRFVFSDAELLSDLVYLAQCGCSPVFLREEQSDGSQMLFFYTVLGGAFISSALLNYSKLLSYFMSYAHDGSPVQCHWKQTFSLCSFVLMERWDVGLSVHAAVMTSSDPAGESSWAPQLFRE